jgi:hypothetical protein
LQGFHALRWAQADLRCAAGHLEGTAKQDVEEAIAELESQRVASRPTTFLVGGGRLSL